MSALDERTQEQLLAERDFLLNSLTDLEAERSAGDIAEHDSAALKDDYTVRAAEVLRAIDQLTQDEQPQSAPSTGSAPRPRRSRWRPLAWGAGVAVFAVIAGLLVERGA